MEDHPLMQDAVAKILSDRYDLVGIIAEGNAVLGAVQNLKPDAIILDISLPDISGMQVLPKLRIAFPGIAIVILTTNVGPIYQQEALTRGAHEFVSKFQATVDLLPAIERAVEAVQVMNPPRARRTKGRHHRRS